MFVGATHVSEPERAALERLEEWGLVDVFRQLYDDEGLFTWWDYRAGSFHKHEGLRIDLILLTESLAAGATYGLIDRSAVKGREAFGPRPGLHRRGGRLSVGVAARPARSAATRRVPSARPIRPVPAVATRSIGASQGDGRRSTARPDPVARTRAHEQCRSREALVSAT